MNRKIILILALIIFPLLIEAQTKKDDKKESKVKSIKDLTKSSNKISGLFTMYQDSINGKLKMVVSENQLKKESIIYFVFS